MLTARRPFSNEDPRVLHRIVHGRQHHRWHGPAWRRRSKRSCSSYSRRTLRSARPRCARYSTGLTSSSSRLNRNVERPVLASGPSRPRSHPPLCPRPPRPHRLRSLGPSRHRGRHLRRGSSRCSSRPVQEARSNTSTWWGRSYAVLLLLRPCRSRPRRSSSARSSSICSAPFGYAPTRLRGPRCCAPRSRPTPPPSTTCFAPSPFWSRSRTRPSRSSVRKRARCTPSRVRLRRLRRSMSTPRTGSWRRTAVSSSR